MSMKGVGLWVWDYKWDCVAVSHAEPSSASHLPL